MTMTQQIEEALHADSSLAGRTILMSGGSRGIGLAIAERAARDGANVAILAKTDTPHSSLPGTVHTAVEAINAAGGRGLAIVGDVRDDDEIARAVQSTIDEFGGIDIVVNNASAIDTRPTTEIDMKRYDLMADINARGTFALSRAAIPALTESDHAQILTLSPPLNLTPYWAGKHLAYTMAKYGMSLTTLGLAEELKDRAIGVNSLWPVTMIDTAALRAIPGAQKFLEASRGPEIMADAAHVILGSDPTIVTGNFFTDEEVLAAAGVSDLSDYSRGAAEEDLVADIFLSDGSDDVHTGELG